MKTLKKTYLFTIVILVLSHSLIAQEKFSIEGEFRPRSEFRHGYKTLSKSGDSPAVFVSQRSRVRFNYNNDKINTRFTLFDYRVWGDQLLKKDIPSVGVHEAWADIKLADHSWLKIGRQSVQYDNGRLITKANWNQIGASHDAIRFRHSKNDFDFELLTTWNQNKVNTFGTDYSFDGVSATSFYKNLNVLWVSKKTQSNQISLLTLLDGYEDVIETDSGLVNNPNKLNYRLTTGLVCKQKIGSFTASARGFYQGGKLYTGKSVSAYYFNMEIDYKINAQSKFQLGIEVLSGTDHSDLNNNTSNAFDILYGARHKFNGRIDYFSIPSTTQEAGLINPYACFDHDFGKQLDISLEYHLFYLQKSYLLNSSSGEVDKYLGQEIDLSINKKINNYMNISGGYSIIFGSDTLEKLKGGDKSRLNNWAFVMLTINPTFFSSKNE